MCGLVGLAGVIENKERQAFRRMLELDTFRGPHSTGMAHVASGGNTNILKVVGTPWDLYDHRAFTAVLQQKAIALIGHNRWATTGKVNKTNAHPFDHKHIIGVHNGTLRRQSLLDDHQNFEVDSENIFYHMSKNGVEDTISKLDGAFALVWYNSEENTLNFIRNDARPLFYAYTLDHKTLLWASEDWMIMVAAKKAEVEIGTIHSAKEMEHMQFDMPLTFKDRNAAEQVPEPTTKIHTECASLPVVSDYASGWWNPNRYTTNYSREENVSKPKGAGMVGRRIDFETVGESGQIGDNKGHYILARGLDKPHFTVVVRSFDGKNPKHVQLRDSMMESSGYFSGVVTGYTTKTHVENDPLGINLLVNVSINSHAIEEFEWFDEEVYEEEEERGVAVYPLRDGTLCEADAWEEAVGSCSYCGDPISCLDYDEVGWYNSGEREETACPSCESFIQTNQKGESYVFTNR